MLSWICLPSVLEPLAPAQLVGDGHRVQHHARGLVAFGDSAWAHGLSSCLFHVRRTARGFQNKIAQGSLRLLLFVVCSGDPASEPRARP